MSGQGVGVILLVTAAVIPTDASAMDWKPELKVEARYDDNVHEGEHGIGDLVWVIAPGLGVTRPGRIANWRAWAGRSMLFYSSSATSPTTTDAASLRGAYRPGGRTSVDIVLDGLRARNDSEPGQRSVVFPASYGSGTGVANLNSTHLETSVRVSALNFRNESRADATTKRLGVSVIPVRTRTSAWLLSYRGEELDLNGSVRLASNAAMAGFRRRHFAGLGSQWELGAAKVDYRDGSPTRTRAAVATRVTVYGREASEPVVAEMKWEQDVTANVSAMLQRKTPLGTASATWSRQLEAQGGYYTVPVIVHRLSIALVDSLGPRTSVRIEGSHDATRPFRSPGYRTNNDRAGIFLSTLAHSWMIGRIGYDFTQQTNPDPALPIHFRRGRVIVSLSTNIQ